MTKRIGAGTSGNFNGYGDLGSWVPPKKGAKATPGEFKAIVGCNDCQDPGWALTEPAFLQTWADDGTSLKLTKNVSISFSGSPAAFVAKGFGFQPDDVVRTKDGSLLMSLYGYARDGPAARKYTTAFYASMDEGITWTYASRVDVTKDMTKPGDGSPGR